VTPSPFLALLGAIVKQRGVLGSMVVSEADGIIVDSYLQMGVRGNVVAALAASLYRKARLAATAAGFGDAGFLQLEAEYGRVCAIGREDLILVTIADTRANVGLIRVEMLRGLETLG
jgi:predicted regulator of Ras-like GTPase activity (Roadblock/LC7/MglB family)